MNRIIAVTSIIFIFLGLTTNAQENTNKGLFAGGQASTNGLGLQAGYVLNNRITFRTGFETMNLGFNFNFDENDITYNTNIDYKTGGVFLLADFFVTKHIYFSAGGILNSFNPEINGRATSDMQYGDITIPAEKVGDFIFTIEPKVKLAPYAGLGFRNFTGKKERVLCNLETGFYYMGGPKLNIEATGLLSPTADPAHGHEEYLENQFSNYKIYPVLKLSLAFKLF